MIILVMGMHRSGTSALAGMLHSGGIFMGDQLVGQSRNNPKGHFEDRYLLSLDNQILGFFGGSWRNVPENMEYKNLPLQISAKMVGLHKSYEDKKIRGWKDPRMPVLFPVWYEVLKAEEIVFLHVVRHPEEVLQSLRKRHGKFPVEEAYSLWRLHNQAVQVHADKYNIKRLVIDFPDMIKFPRVIKERVEEFTGVQLHEESYQFIEKRHKHWNIQETISHDYTDIPKLLQET